MYRGALFCYRWMYRGTMFWFLKVVTLLISFINAQTQNEGWSAWSNCSKSCDIGKQERTRVIDNTTLKDEQYCNLQYCPDIWKNCVQSIPNDCWIRYPNIFPLVGSQCNNQSRCICTFGVTRSPYYNIYNCQPDYGNCTIRLNPPFFVAQINNNQGRLWSCVTKDNQMYEVHMIGTHGSSIFGDDYVVKIRARGDTSKKPIVIALSSYYPIQWHIDSTVAIYAVVYDGYYLRRPVSDITNFSCNISNIYRLKGMAYTHGDDRHGGDTISALKTVSKVFGEVTSFTGFYNLVGNKEVILHVGGNPLQSQRTHWGIANPHCKSIDGSATSSSVNGSSRNTDLFTWSPVSSASHYHWSTWSQCSKSCDIGTRIRRRLRNYSTETDREYCNVHYCPNIWMNCNQTVSNDCWRRYIDIFPVLGSTCNHQNRCICTIGSTPSLYNKYNCRPVFGNCVIRKDPPFALGSVDTIKNGYRLNSCVTHGSGHYEVHMIGTYGASRFNDFYRVNIRARGDTSRRPIVIALSSDEAVQWTINTSVDIHAIVYDGRFNPSVHISGSSCNVKRIFRLRGIRSAYGDDVIGGDTIAALKVLREYFGPITSFTGFYQLMWKMTVTLQVGGNPLQVLPESYNYFQRNQCKMTTSSSIMSTPTTFITTTSKTAAFSPEPKSTGTSTDNALKIIMPSISGSIIFIFFLLMVLYRLHAKKCFKRRACQSPANIQRQRLQTSNPIYEAQTQNISNNQCVQQSSNQLHMQGGPYIYMDTDLQPTVSYIRQFNQNIYSISPPPYETLFPMSGNIQPPLYDDVVNDSNTRIIETGVVE